MKAGDKETNIHVRSRLQLPDKTREYKIRIQRFSIVTLFIIPIPDEDVAARLRSLGQ
jgi:hypothetical protein